MDGHVVDHVKELWDRLAVLRQSIQDMPFHEGLKPLKCYESVDELLSMASSSLLRDLAGINNSIRTMMNETVPYINNDGTCKSINFNVQPLIGVIYGPTGSGKSQLLRNLISSQLINPPPETVFFVTPQIDMIPPQEIAAWETQICEGNYQAGDECTIVPQSGALMPEFIKLSYPELTTEANYDVTDPNNIFARAASKGPIAIIIDECMEDLGSHKAIAKFFHAFPSKLHDRFPKCLGYTVLVVLHNMNPRRDLGGNISNLRIQSKLHIVSPKMHPMQLNRFINNYTKGLPLPITLILKDIINYHRMHSKYDWIVYNTQPVNEAMEWMYLSPSDGLMPMYLNVQSEVYKALEKINKSMCEKERWTRYYRNKN